MAGQKKQDSEIQRINWDFCQITREKPQCVPPPALNGWGTGEFWNRLHGKADKRVPHTQYVCSGYCWRESEMCSNLCINKGRTFFKQLYIVCVTWIQFICFKCSAIYLCNYTTVTTVRFYPIPLKVLCSQSLPNWSHSLYLMFSVTVVLTFLEFHINGKSWVKVMFSLWPSLSLYDIFKIHPCCYSYLQLIPFYCQIIFHCM